MNILKELRKLEDLFEREFVDFPRSKELDRYIRNIRKNVDKRAILAVAKDFEKAWDMIIPKENFNDKILAFLAHAMGIENIRTYLKDKYLPEK